MSYEEVLKPVFSKLDGVDLASCMLVCKQWRVVALDECLWKCLCARRWPSIWKKPNPPTVVFYKLYQTLYKRQYLRTLPPARLSFDDLEFFIDIWSEDKYFFSEVVSLPILQSEYKITLTVEPRFRIALTSHIARTLSVSVLAGRKDTNKVATVIDKGIFSNIYLRSCKAVACDQLDFSPMHPFMLPVTACFKLLFKTEGDEGIMDVFGIEMSFQLDSCEGANSKEQVLWLLDMLNWN